MPVTDVQTDEVSQQVEWLTPFPTDGMQPIFVASDDSPWHVIPHWAMVGGKAMLVGIDIRCFVEVYDRHDDVQDRQPVGRELVELTQQVLRGISLSAVREESRAHLTSKLVELAKACPPGRFADYSSNVATAMTTKGRPRKRRAPVRDELLTHVAQLYNVALASGSATPARYVEERLRKEGVDVSTRGGRDQVRKWIQRARQSGMLPPAR
jgi:hypothetical protein